MIVEALSTARDHAEKAQHYARVALTTSFGERRVSLLRSARAHALETAAAAQRAIDLLEST